MKIATWNIAGGHKMRSLDNFDYEAGINIDYFVEQLASLGCDIVCLQESQCNAGYSVANQIAAGLGMPYMFETAMHPSHVDKEYKLSLAILSKLPFASTKAVTQPYPSFDLYLPNGKPAGRYDNHLQIVKVGGTYVANTMNQPLEYLGHPYEDELGEAYAKELDTFFIAELQPPLVFAGDFNTGNPGTTFAATWKALGLKDAVPQGSTKPHGTGHLDCIFIDKHSAIVQNAIVRTETDHFLCWAEVS